MDLVKQIFGHLYKFLIILNKTNKPVERILPLPFDKFFQDNTVRNYNFFFFFKEKKKGKKILNLANLIPYYSSQQHQRRLLVITFFLEKTVMKKGAYNIN
jgi:hypothetical protein